MALRYGIIGCGSMGCEHILSILALEEAGVITALCDQHQPSLTKAMGLLPPNAMAPQIFSDAASLATSGLCDAVVVATPNFTHAKILIQILNAPVHILVEKPLCTKLADGYHLVEAARNRPHLVWVALEYRYMPPVAEAIRLAKQGELGRLHQISIREHREPFYPKVADWNRFEENTGGTLVEKCCHYFNLMEHIFGAPALSVYAAGGQDVNHLDEIYQGRVPDILDAALVIVDFGEGRRAMLDLCMYAENTLDKEQMVIVGDAGRVESNLPSGLVKVGMRKDWGVRRTWGEASGNATGVSCRQIYDTRIRYQGQHFGASYLEHSHFAQAIKGGNRAEIGLEEGLRSVAIGLAAERSRRTGHVIMLDSMLAEARI